MTGLAVDFCDSTLQLLAKVAQTFPEMLSGLWSAELADRLKLLLSGSKRLNEERKTE